LFGIAAAIIGAIAAAYIGFRIKSYRSLVTYEITNVECEVSISDEKVVPHDPASLDTSTHIQSTFVKIVNRGWKDAGDVRLHADRGCHPFSVAKTASSVGLETISLQRRGDSLELGIEFLPSKEEITVAFSSLGRFAGLYKFAGGGATYRVESIHYYLGFQKALNFLKSLIFYLVIGVVGGLVVGAAILNAVHPKPQPAQVQKTNKP